MHNIMLLCAKQTPLNKCYSHLIFWFLKYSFDVLISSWVICQAKLPIVVKKWNQSLLAHWDCTLTSFPSIARKRFNSIHSLTGYWDHIRFQYSNDLDTQNPDTFKKWTFLSWVIAWSRHCLDHSNPVPNTVGARILNIQIKNPFEILSFKDWFWSGQYCSYS